MINARVETAATKPAFRDAMKSRRCLIPADGFYEWVRTAKAKQPYCFEVNEGQLFAFAGIWDRWKDTSGKLVETCSILTTTPNAVTSPVHDRMPVILDPDSYDLWLDPGMRDVAAASELLKPCDSRLMRCYPIALGSTTWRTTMRNARHLWNWRRFRIGSFDRLCGATIGNRTLSGDYLPQDRSRIENSCQITISVLPTKSASTPQLLWC